MFASHSLIPLHMHKYQALGWLGAASLMLVAGCSGTVDTDGDNTSDDGVITIGAIAPLTGDASAYGIEMQRVAELARADINEAWAEEGMELVIQWEDGVCNGSDTSSAAQKLVDIDKVEVILGGLCSSETLAAAPITEAAGVILFSYASSSPEVTNAGDYVYRNWPSDSYQSVILADIAEEMGYETVGFISEVHDYSLGISSAFTENFDGTVIEETFLPEATDFKTEITKLQSESPDIYFVNAQTPVKGEVILKQMKELGIEGPFLINDGTGTNVDLLETYADYLEGSYTAAVDVTSDEAIQMQTQYEEMFGESMNYLAYDSATYDAVWILANAIAEVGNDADAIKAYLDELEYTGMMGTYSFDENGDPTSGHSLGMIEGGALVIQ
jgi:branched-chain amino acid transport system substrate-binding protein